jgi:hypothetical protein
MRQAKIRFGRGGPQIVLFSRNGFTPGLVKAATTRDDVTLLGAQELIEQILDEPESD